MKISTQKSFRLFVKSLPKNMVVVVALAKAIAGLYLIYRKIFGCP